MDGDLKPIRSDFGLISGRKPWILKVPRLGQLFGGPVHLAEGARNTQFHFEVNLSFGSRFEADLGIWADFGPILG